MKIKFCSCRVRYSVFGPVILQEVGGTKVYRAGSLSNRNSLLSRTGLFLVSQLLTSFSQADGDMQADVYPFLKFICSLFQTKYFKTLALPADLYDGRGCAV